MGVVRSFAGSVAGGAAGGYMVTKLLLDPRRVGRKVVASLFILGTIPFLYLIWFSIADTGDVRGMVGVATFFTLIAVFIGAVAVSKFVTRYPFSTFIYGRYIRAAFVTGKTAQVWWAVALVGLLGTIVSTLTTSMGGIGLFVTVILVAIFGIGITAVGVEKKVVETALSVRNEVARAIGAHPETVEVGNTGTLRQPEYTCFFPMLIPDEQLHTTELNIQRLLPAFKIAGIEDRGVSLTKA